MVEPAWTDARIRLARTPHIALLHAIVQHVPGCITLAGHQTPVRLTHITGFRSYPAQITTIATIVPNNGMRLQLTNHAESLCPPIVGLSVNLTYLIGTTIPPVTTIGTIEPHLKDVTIVRQQFAQLVAEVGHVFWFAVVLMVPVPRRKVDSELQPLLATSLSQLTHYVTPTLLPRRVLDGVRCIGRRPHTETTVVLGCEDDTLHTRLFTDACPLPAVKVRWVKQFQRLIAEAPFLVGVRIQRIMDEGIHLHILPPQLILRRYRATGRHMLHLPKCQHGQHSH